MKNWLETKIKLHQYDDAKAERENMLTHLVALIFAIFGLFYIIFNLNGVSSFNLKVGLIVFALTNILMYFASSMYHHLKIGNPKRVFRILDHSNIYFLIAGTYTPILLSANTKLMNNVTLLIWGIAILGIVFTIVFWERFKIFHVIAYLVMGWLIIFFWNDVIPYLPKGLLTYIALGGITYSAGVGFYASKKLPHYHAIWHCFVAGGSVFFYLGICSKLL